MVKVKLKRPNPFWSYPLSISGIVRCDFGLCMFTRKGFFSARQSCFASHVIGTSKAGSKLISRQRKDVLLGLDQAQSKSLQQMSSHLLMQFYNSKNAHKYLAIVVKS